MYVKECREYVKKAESTYDNVHEEIEDTLSNLLSIYTSQKLNYEQNRIAKFNKDVYLSRINSIYYSDIDKNADNIKEYSTKSNNDIINDIYKSYDLSLNSKYKVKTFNQTIDRVKNYFR